MRCLALTVGSIWKHYRNKKLYLIEHVNVVHTETLEEMVVYRSLYNSDTTKFMNFQVWTRPQCMFLDMIEHNGNTVPRFELISDQK